MTLNLAETSVVNSRLSVLYVANFYSLGVIPANQPSMSKCWGPRTSGLASSFLHPSLDSWWKRRCFLYTGCL